MKQLKSIFSLLLLFFFSSSFSQTIEVKPYEVHKVLSLKLNTIIGAAALDYLERGHKKAVAEKFDLIVIEMNTPGGLLSTTKEILSLMGESDIPFVVWVNPAGGSATSAGAIIASGAHVLVMSEGTNIGAATPISLSGENIAPDENEASKKTSDLKDQVTKKVKDTHSDLARKALNDLRANIESLSQLRGRNSAGFARMIDEGTSYNAQNALKEKLIDGIANNRFEVEKVLALKKISIKGVQFEMKPDRVQWIVMEMDLGQKILNVFASPALAYILFLIGCALIYLELQAPGGYIAGGVGVISIILAALGLQVLPINYGGLGLIIVAFVCFIIEIYVTSFGILAIVGLIAMYFGSSMLYHVDGVFFTFPKMVIYSTMSAVSLSFAFFGYLLKKEKAPSESLLTLKNHTALVVGQLNTGHYQVKVQGEIWRAKSSESLNIGDEIIVVEENKNEMFLIVKKNKL